MPRQTWIIASVLSALVVIGFLGFSLWEQNRESEELRATLEHSQKQAESLKTDLNSGLAQIEQLRREKEAAARQRDSLETEMRTALESKDITISQLQGKLTVNILDRILFDSGEAVLKPEGEKVLQQIAAILAQHPTRQIHVIGHTDNVPIRASARSRYASNWELSTARATAAVRYLAEEGGVDPRRLGAVGYGEYHPIADNSIPEGRAKNRRIAIVVLSEELAGSDAIPVTIPSPKPSAGTSSTTNAPGQGVAAPVAPPLTNVVPATSNVPAAPPAPAIPAPKENSGP